MMDAEGMPERRQRRQTREYSGGGYYQGYGMWHGK